MTAGLQVVLLVFAIIGYAGAGASLATVRTRYVVHGETDAGMGAVALMLFTFGLVCTLVDSGLMGVLAVGTVGTWLGYVVAAQRLGLFRIETEWPEAEHATEPRQTT